jgi:hypothetical protein
LDPDIALLQEVGALPESVLAAYEWRGQAAVGKTGRAQSFQTGILSRYRFGERVHLCNSEDWVAAELAGFAGNLVAYEILPSEGATVTAVSVYSPAWPVARTRLAGIDTSRVQLTQNRDVWVSDVLWASLLPSGLTERGNWIIGGDFNLSETFDLWSGGPRGNAEYLDRMRQLGLVECLRDTARALTPTFRNPSGGAIKHQIDHLFVTSALAGRLSACRTGELERVFGSGLSDHLRIVADFVAERSSRSSVAW